MCKIFRPVPLMIFEILGFTLKYENNKILYIYIYRYSDIDRYSDGRGFGQLCLYIQKFRCTLSLSVIIPF